MYFYDDGENPDKDLEDLGDEMANNEAEEEDGAEGEGGEAGGEGGEGSLKDDLKDIVNDLKNNGQGDDLTKSPEDSDKNGESKDGATDGEKGTDGTGSGDSSGDKLDLPDQDTQDVVDKLNDLKDAASNPDNNGTGNNSADGSSNNGDTSTNNQQNNKDNNGTGSRDTTDGSSSNNGQTSDNSTDRSSNNGQNGDGSTGGHGEKPDGNNGAPTPDGEGGGLNLGDAGGMLTSGVKGLANDGVKGAGKEVAKEVAKQQIKKQMAKAGIDVMLKSAASALAPILFWVAVVVVIIIIAVGIIMFIVAMPGQIVGKVKDLASDLYKAWTAMIEGEDTQVSTAQLASVANYIEKMGYDLKGEGFVSYDKMESNPEGNDIEETITNLTHIFSKEYDKTSDLAGMDATQLRSLLYLDTTQGVIRRNDTNEVVDLNSEPLLSYIISDNQCYIIRNFNTTLDNMTDGQGDFIGKIILGVAAVVGAIVMIFTPVGWIASLVLGVAAAAAVAGGSYLAVKMNNNPEYGRGLITLWHESAVGGIGVVDGYYEVGEKGEIALDAQSKKLIVKRGWANGSYTFNVDGWSGRYGMPLEFLLSVHLATQMPELAVEMATSFETDVEIILHEVNGEMTAGVLKQNTDGSWATGSTDDDFITYDIISQLGHEEQGWIQGLWEGLKDAANGAVGFFTGDKVWTEEELEVLGINARVLYELFEQGMPHASDCTCCTHIQRGAGAEDEACSGDDDIYNDSGDIANGHNICKSCESRVLKIIAALAVTSDKEWESYTPYISKVTDHWFRDVYFVMNTAVGDQPNEIQDVIKVDEDYFYETGERWTMYEVWEEGDNIPDGFEVGDYKLYDENGVLSDKTKAQVQEDNEKIALGDTSLTRLTKKAITESLVPNLENGGWSAYELTDSDNTLPWEKLTVSEDSTDEVKADEVYQDEDASTPEDIIIYYKETRPADIKQVEDGQRTQTNEKIKHMFLDNAYYKYDGSVERANAIIKDKSRADNKVENYNTDNDARDEKLIAKVNITKDSLGAFSILENTHTLDADYIYRDFKELIVELDYFDKEDLSDKIETVMQWLIPDCGSAGWPIRKYEKGENYYGTLINSKIDLKYMKAKDIEEAEKTLAELQEEVESEGTTGASGGGGTGTPNGSVADFVKYGYDIHSVMEGNNWDYCILSDIDGSGDPHMSALCPIRKTCKQQHCDTKNSPSSHVCGLDDSIEEAESNNHNTCCATYVSWVLNKIGYGFVSDGAKATYTWCEQQGFTKITDYSQLKPGDLLFNRADYSGPDTSQIGHVQLLGDNGEWLNAGSVTSINNPPYVDDPNFIIGMRTTLNGAAAEFEGYDPEQVVVAPVTGKIVEHGFVTRKNIETDEDEQVGFIKIQALDHYITGYKGQYVTSSSGCTTEDTEYDPDNTYDPEKKEGYDYFYEEYKGVLDGCVLYIEGVDLTLVETLSNSDFKSQDVTRYTPNTVYNMTDNLKEAQALWREDAKEAAAPYFTDGEDVYIKEGTVIGKTRQDTEFAEGATGNGNYIRLILRDLEDSIMEDVETYFYIPQSYRFNGSVGNIQNIESADPTLMTLIEQLAGPLEGEYPGIVNILKAISMNESGGGTNPAAGDDPMQAVESTGGNAGDSIGGWENSVKAGINALTASWDKAKGYGINDLRVVIQAYNYGPGFVDYVHNSGANAYTKDLASSFSDQQAEKLGWSGYGDKNYVDPKIYKYLPDLNV